VSQYFVHTVAGLPITVLSAKAYALLTVTIRGGSMKVS
jgi:hypothetical protein